MTRQEIHTNLKRILDDLAKIDSSKQPTNQIIANTMQINPILLDRTKTVDYLTSVLNRIEPMFGFNLSSICERHGNCPQDISQELLVVFSIRELKSLADLLGFWLEVSSSPKRSSKISLSRWIAEILLYIQQTIHGLIAESLSNIVVVP